MYYLYFFCLTHSYTTEILPLVTCTCKINYVCVCTHLCTYEFLPPPSLSHTRWREYRSKSSSVDSLRSAFQYALVGTKKVARRHGNWFTRWAAFEARGAKRLTLGAVLYLPLFFLAFGIILGKLWMFKCITHVITVNVYKYAFTIIVVRHVPALSVFVHSRLCKLSYN